MDASSFHFFVEREHLAFLMAQFVETVDQDDIHCPRMDVVEEGGFLWVFCLIVDSNYLPSLFLCIVTTFRQSRGKVSFDTLAPLTRQLFDINSDAWSLLHLLASLFVGECIFFPKNVRDGDNNRADLRIGGER